MPNHEQNAGTTASSSRTVTAEQTPPLVVQLRAAPGTDDRQQEQTTPRRQVRWTEDVIDNEHMNKKKSKICCIFTKSREFGESSSDESSDSDSDSDSESESESNHDCNHDHDHEHNHSEHRGRASSSRRSGRLPSPNAYERQPKYKKTTRNTSGSSTTTATVKP